MDEAARLRPQTQFVRDYSRTNDAAQTRAQRAKAAGDYYFSEAAGATALGATAAYLWLAPFRPSPLAGLAVLGARCLASAIERDADNEHVRTAARVASFALHGATLACWAPAFMVGSPVILLAAGAAIVGACFGAYRFGIANPQAELPCASALEKCKEWALRGTLVWLLLPLPRVAPVLVIDAIAFAINLGISGVSAFRDGQQAAKGDPKASREAARRVLYPLTMAACNTRIPHFSGF